MRYGLPYHGSKNAIAEWVINELPAAPCFADLFGGGGAITHRAILSGKYKAFIYNDINPLIPKFFLECIEGKHTIKTHSEWISRERFHKDKATDAYIALCWSFGNDGDSYLYGEDIEEYKHDYHNAVFLGDLEPLRGYGLNISDPQTKSPYKRYLSLKTQIKQQLPEGERLLGFERLTRLEQMQKLKDNLSHRRFVELDYLPRMKHVEQLAGISAHGLQVCGGDYQDIYTPEGALIYCDIPYNQTKCGMYNGFNHDRFYEWAEGKENIFISEYQMPPEFIEIASIEKEVLSAKTAIGKTTERLFTNKRTYDKMNDNQKARIFLNSAKQLTLFDL